MTADDVNAAMKEYASYEGILDYEPDDLVSMDFVGDPLLDLCAEARMVMGDKMVRSLVVFVTSGRTATG